MAVKLKIFTFNLRVAVRADGDNYFWNRTDGIREVLEREKPDLIGFQEVTDPMRTWLRDTLGDYVCLGCGRETGYRGEGTVIAYRRDAFELIGFRQFWLSDTPSVPGTRYESSDQSQCPRMTGAATLKHHEAKEVLTFYNTHLDHRGVEARLFGARQIVADMARIGGKMILTGDMNARPDTAEIRAFGEGPVPGLTDVTAALGGTFHDFGRKTPGKIDYIFTNADCDPTESRIIEDIPKDGVYLSDHYPVCAYVTIE